MDVDLRANRYRNSAIRPYLLLRQWASVISTTFSRLEIVKSKYGSVANRRSRTCRPFAPNQAAFTEDRGFIDWLDGSFGTH
jgi:hypothetical protein